MLSATAVTLLAAAAFGQELHLKTRDVYTGPPEPGRPTAQARARRLGPSHQIIQFDHPPGVEDLDALLAAGARAIAVVPDNAVSVMVPEDVNISAAGVRWSGELEARDKLSPVLETQAADPKNEIAAIVEFHADVETDVQQAIIDAESVASGRPAARVAGGGLLPTHTVVSTTIDRLRALAAHDEVAYIFPADPALMIGNEMMPCGGMLTIAGAIAQYANIVRGWELDSDRVLHLGYVFGAMSPKVPANTIQAEVIRALNEWSKGANIVFHPGSSATDPRTVVVKFGIGSHGDAYPFDGPGGTLGHTFYPVPINPESIAGDMHLDGDENWHAGGDVDIYSVALHEVGHALGLGHSDKPGDVMYPYYRRGMQLSANDIGAARLLYGAPSGAVPVPAPTPVTTPVTTPTAPTVPTPSPLSLTLNPITPPGQASQSSIGGTISGGTAPFTVQWQTDRGYTGKAVVGSSGTWSAAGVTLGTGANTITVTGFDAGKRSASQSATVTRTAAVPTGGTAPLSVLISSPSSSVVTAKGATISLSGKAAGGTGVTQVTWQTSGGASGTATGLDRWVATGVPLLTGTNTIVVRSYDARGVTAWATVVVVRQ